MELSLDPNKRYTYADYLTWLDDKTRELIHGFIQKMSPAPRSEHARVSGDIYWHLDSIVRKNKAKCKVYSAPFDVRFPKHGETADNKIDTVVQPDICIICDLSKIDERGCCGAPDMIVEILSPSTAKKDLTYKFALYEESGVKEYWVVYPKDKAITVFLLQENGIYDNGTTYEWDVKIPVRIFDNHLIALNDIFEGL
ncbi:MAG: Uma2 family endonuclease [Chitinophagaceae bacterium]|jgi:Uma2 family endonuclease|nr:Uma2 family endonuclease [Chitinophagaceae bacterium]